MSLLRSGAGPTIESWYASSVVDLALGMLKLVQETLRPELKLVVMSATLSAADIALYLGGCPVVSSEGRLFPIDIQYEPRPGVDPWPLVAARAAERLLERTDG